MLKADEFCLDKLTKCQSFAIGTDFGNLLEKQRKMANTNNGSASFAKSVENFIKEIVTDFPSNVSKTVREDVLSFPPVNIIEKPGSFSVELSIPGYEKQDFIIKLSDRTLTVSSNKLDEPLEATDRNLKKEFTRRQFTRNFTLTDNVIKESISAKYENGILKIYLPKEFSSTSNNQDIPVQ